VGAYDNRFDPPRTQTKVGFEVQWVTANNVNRHTVTSDDGLFDGEVSPFTNDEDRYGVTRFAYTVMQIGTYRYYCKIHGGPGGQGMSGVIEVIEG
jgi:plastocyanin